MTVNGPVPPSTPEASGNKWGHRVQRGVRGALAVFVVGVVGLELAVRLVEVPRLEEARVESVRYHASDASLLREAVGEGGERSRFVVRAELSPTIVAATLAIEDARFYEHKGVDFLSVGWAAVENVRAGRIVRGGSTLTMQLARMLRPHPRTFAGKIREAVVALAMERAYSKDAILEAYLNRAPYGAGTRGVEAAALAYFGRPHGDLSLAEAALVAGIPQRPTSLNPRRHPAAALARRSLVLNRMEAESRAGAGPTFDADAFERAMREPLALTTSPVAEPLGLHFTEWIRTAWEHRAGGASSGEGPRKLSGDIETTLNATWQRQAQQLVAQHVAALQAGGARDSAVVVVDNATCGVRVMVGSASYFNARGGAVNAATAPRQPGSTLKPFTYALAFERGYSPRSIVADVESFYGAPDGEVFRPRNYSETFHGPVLMGEALGRSLNVPAIRTMGLLEIGALLERLKKLGITSLDKSAEHYGLGLTLGNGEVTLLELVGAYAALARGGSPCVPAGRPEAAAPNRHLGPPEIEPGVVVMVRRVLEDEALRQRAFGPRNALMLGMPIAVKTGTSSNWRDTWAVGFTDAVTIGVWTGDVEGAPTKRLAGATGAGPLFHQVAKAFGPKAALKYPPPPVPLPEGLVDVEVCALSGKLPHEHCDHRTTVVVRRGDVPDEECTWHRLVRVDVRNGLRAGPQCPKRFVTERAFVALPGSYAEWQASSILEAPPRTSSPLCPDEGRIPDAVVVRYPRASEVFVVEPGYDRRHQSIQLRGEVDPPTEVATWLVDGLAIGTAKWPYVFHWKLARGRHEIVLQAKGQRSDPVPFEVR